MSDASCQFVLVYVVDERMFDGGHDHDDDELGFDPELASSSTIKIESLFQSKRYNNKKKRKSKNIEIIHHFTSLFLSHGIPLHSFCRFFSFMISVPDGISFFSHEHLTENEE